MNPKTARFLNVWLWHAALVFTAGLLTPVLLTCGAWIGWAIGYGIGLALCITIAPAHAWIFVRHNLDLK